MKELKLDRLNPENKESIEKLHSLIKSQIKNDFSYFVKHKETSKVDARQLLEEIIEELGEIVGSN